MLFEGATATAAVLMTVADAPLPPGVTLSLWLGARKNCLRETPTGAVRPVVDSASDLDTGSDEVETEQLPRGASALALGIVSCVGMEHADSPRPTDSSAARP